MTSSVAAIDSDEVVLGVDTHRDQHTAAVVSVAGLLRGCRQFPATGTGYRDLLCWARGLGVVRRAGVECTGSYGMSLSRVLQGERVSVFDVNQPDRQARRHRGKTDEVDAEAAARAVLAGRARAVAKASDGPVEALRQLKIVRDSAVQARTKALNQLKAVIVTADPAIREAFSGLSTKGLVRRCVQLGEGDGPDAVTRYALATLAERIIALTSEADRTEQRITALVDAVRPALLERIGIGPDSAATLLIVAGDNPERVQRQTSFAALCGVSPVEASSGNTQRRRLNRGGDRQANAALHRIVVSRLRWDTRTQAYMQRRLAEGRTRREVIRCLKRFVAREVFGLINPPDPVTATPSIAA
jgi:transposase